MHIVLVEPEIPSNTGNISRTCAVTGATLHLVGKLGFSVDDKQLRRAGLDYWDSLDLHYHESFEKLERKYPEARFFPASTKAANNYAKFSYQSDDFFIFGKETAGLPRYIIDKYAASAIRIPMGEKLRSLNLSNAVAIVLYEALRQTGFPELR